MKASRGLHGKVAFAGTGNRERTPGWPSLAWPGLLMGAIFLASGQSSVPSSPWALPHLDKLVHCGLFGLLATSLVRVAPLWRKLGWHPAWTIAAVAVLGAGDEWRQSFTPGRQVDVADWVADTLGAIVAVTAYLVWPAYRRALESRLGRKRRIEIAGEFSNTVRR